MVWQVFMTIGVVGAMAALVWTVPKITKWVSEIARRLHRLY